jgi:hypothetical protein
MSDLGSFPSPNHIFNATEGTPHTHVFVANNNIKGIAATAEVLKKQPSILFSLLIDIRLKL